MMMMINRGIFALYIIFQSYLAIGQQIDDQQLWLNMNLKSEINNRWSVEISPEIRYDKSMQRFKNFNFQIEPTFRIIKDLFADISYRIYTNRTTDDYRIQLGLTYKSKFNNNIRWNSRLSYYFDTKTFDSDYFNEYPVERVLRIRNSVSKQIKKFSFAAISDLRFRINANSTENFNTNRYGITFEYEFHKGHSFQLSNLINTKYSKTSKTDYILSLNYSYEFKLRKLLKTIKKKSRQMKIS